MASNPTPFSSNPQVLIQATRLTRSYGTAASLVTALDGLDLTVHPGERIALLGKSGSGKSTLLNLLGGLDRPTAGELVVDGMNLQDLSSAQLSKYRAKLVGMVFQSFNLLPARTALQNVELPMIFQGRSRNERTEEAANALRRVGLGHRLNHLPTQMSGGEKQRVAVARSLVNRPRILLADEPTGNLDTKTAQEVMFLIMEHIRNQNATLILVTHDEELARAHTDRIVRMRDGRIVS